MKERIIEPELLETFPDDHPSAITSRQDLLVVNHVMGNHRWIMRTLRKHVKSGWRIAEIGAGDGALSLQLVDAGICEPADIHGLDLVNRPQQWPNHAAWTQGDIFAQSLPDTEVLIANLILHHFTNEQLSNLARRISPRTQLIIAAEPARYRVHSMLGAVLCVLAHFHPVTRYDMQVSIRAGFRDRELEHALALDQSWECESSVTIKGAYHFIANRDAS